jgi:hypothetical protein
MPSSITDLFSALQNGVVALGKIAKSISTSFPQVTGTSTSATTGSVTFNSSQPVGFITIVSTSGATQKIPYFNP